MIVKNLEVEKIVLTSIDTKARKLSLQISFSDNASFPVQLTLNENFEAAVEKLLKQLKKDIKPQDPDDYNDALSGVSIVNIKNEEDIMEKAPKRLYMLDRKLDSFKNTRDHRNYMQLYSQFSTIKEVIYQKNPLSTN